MKRPLLLLTLAALAAAPPAAAADTLETPAPGATNLAYGGGYAAWAQPADGGWRLMLRAPDGTVTTPAIGAFGAAPDPSIGSIAGRALGVVYSRCAGASTVSGCDVHQLDIATGVESEVAGLATDTYSETAPAVALGRYSFVRRGTVSAARKGVYAFTGPGGTRRLSSVLARETATNGSRAVYTYNSSRGGGVAIRRLSGDGAVSTPATRLDGVPRSLAATRYQAVWVLGEQVFSTDRFGGSGGGEPEVVTPGRTIPGLDSVNVGTSTTKARFLDAEGIKNPSPSLFR